MPKVKLSAPKAFKGWAVYDFDGNVILRTAAKTRNAAIYFHANAACQSKYDWRIAKNLGYHCRRVRIEPVTKGEK